MTLLCPATSPSPRSATALLRDRNFSPFFFGNLTSNCGIWFHNLAAAIVVFQMTGSAAWVGAITALQFGPALVLSAWAGKLGDRVDRRRLLIAFQAVSCAGAGALTVWAAFGLPGPWPVLAATGVIGIGYAFSIPAMQALVPSLVPAPDLDQAIALNSVTFNLARAIGPAVGAVVLAVLGPAAAFGVNAASYLALILALLVVRPRELAHDGDGDGSLREAVRFLRGDPTTMGLLVAVAAMSFASDPVNTLTPPMAALFGAGEQVVGYMVSAFGAGAFLTALALGRIRRRVGQEWTGVVGLGLLAAGIAAFAASPTAIIATVSLAAAGMGFLMSITSLTTRITQRVPDELLGRVMAAWSIAFLGSRPIAALIDGAVADLVSPRAAALLCAGVALAGMALLWRATTATAD